LGEVEASDRCASLHAAWTSARRSGGAPGPSASQVCLSGVEPAGRVSATGCTTWRVPSASRPAWPAQSVAEVCLFVYVAGW